MPKSSTRIAIEAVAVVALAALAWRVLRREDAPTPPPTKTTVVRAKEDRIGNALQQRRAEEAANRKRELAQNPAAAFKVEATAPSEPINLDKPEGTVTGELVDEQGRRLDTGAVIISEQGGFTLTAVNGAFHGRAAVGSWTAVAQYRDGLQFRRTEPFAVNVEPGRETALRVLIPLAQPNHGGPGFTWVHRGEFLEVETVTEGSPAALAGLAPGDAVTEIGGQPVKDTAAAAIEAALSGEAGTAFRIKVVAHTGNDFTTTVVDLTRVPR
jgi:PDZ domain